MIVRGRVDWKQDVLTAWQRASNHPRPNSDVWRDLPPGVQWYEAEVEQSDISRLYVIGSGDLEETFGSYRVEEIAGRIDGDDRHNHKVRIRGLAQAILGNTDLEPPILVSDSVAGPFTLIDGNHRAVAHLSVGRLVGLRVFLGLSPAIRSAFEWARPAYKRGGDLWRP